jgi:hypothetical protein
MQTAHEAAQKALSSGSSERTERPVSLPTETLMRRLWQRMGEIYGHRWSSAYGEDALAGAGETWAKGLAGLSAVQIGTGLQKALASADPWPPSLPAFRGLCLDIPSFVEVRESFKPGAPEVCPFARHMWTHLDAYELRRADTRLERRMLEEAYALTCDFVMRGGELPKESQRVEHDPDAEQRLYEAQHMEMLTALAGGKLPGLDS